MTEHFYFAHENVKKCPTAEIREVRRVPRTFWRPLSGVPSDAFGVAISIMTERSLKSQKMIFAEILSAMLLDVAVRYRRDLHYDRMNFICLKLCTTQKMSTAKRCSFPITRVRVYV